MSTPDRISTAPPERASMNHSALREEGMEWIRQWARDTWTDHNDHDPGITFLEAASYAMTELGLRLRLDMPDLLRSGETHGSADLEPAHRVLPCGPVTPEDLRKLLLDHPLVKDAQISLAADSEIPFYENTNPAAPLTYVPGGRRVQPCGLYEVVVELAERELNSNGYALNISAGSQNYAAELALPHWDEEEAAAFREGAVVTALAMRTDASEFWRPQAEPQTHFGQLDVAYTDADGTAGQTTLWMLLRITTPLEQPALVTPAILAAARTLVESLAVGEPVSRFVDRAHRAHAAVHRLERYLSGWRNLGENLLRISVAREQEIAVRARLEVTGGIDVEQLLAGIFLDMDGLLSPRIRFLSLAEQRARAEAAGGGADSVYDGPLLQQGFLDGSAPATKGASVLHTSDILRLIMRRRGASGTDLVAQENPGGRDIIAVTDLALSNFINNRAITVDARDCLRLVEIERYRPRLSLSKSRLIPVRNDIEVDFHAEHMESLFLSRRLETKQTTPNPSPVWPVLRGETYPVEDYTPLQNDLPSLYGVGEAALPDSAGPERRAAALQLKGYLLLFEQFLADLTAQMGHVNRFFSADAAESATYFGRPLSDIPGVAALFRQDPAGGDWPPFAEDRDRYLDRRNRMLDHRLARLGEDTAALGQEIHRWAQRELLAGTVAAPASAAMAERRRAANARLIRAKASLLRDAPELSAFRLLAHGHPPWTDSPLERRIARLSGIRSQVRRQLLVSLDEFFEIYDEVDNDGLIEKRWRFWELPGHTGQVLLSSVFHFEAATDALATAMAEESIDQVLRHGLDEWNYQVAQAGTGTFNFELRDPSGQLLALRGVPWNSRREAEQRIGETVDHLYRAYSVEGFHLIEHLLLRPRQGPRPSQGPGDPGYPGDLFLSLPKNSLGRESDPYSHRISLIFPSGYARNFSQPPIPGNRIEAAPHRFRDPEFRRHLERVVWQSCPAHLLTTVYWVDRQVPGTPDSPASFDSFEDRYLAWLDTVRIPGAPAATVQTARNELVEALNAIAQGL